MPDTDRIRELADDIASHTVTTPDGDVPKSLEDYLAGMSDAFDAEDEGISDRVAEELRSRGLNNAADFVQDVADGDDE